MAAPAIERTQHCRERQVQLSTGRLKLYSARSRQHNDRDAPHLLDDQLGHAVAPVAATARCAVDTPQPAVLAILHTPMPVDRNAVISPSAALVTRGLTS